MVNRGGLLIASMFMLTVGGCDRAPSGQSVAVVNGEEISLSELNSELTTTNIPPGADRKTVTPQVLQRLVDRRLLAQAAEEQGIDRTPDFLIQERRLREELLINLLSRRRSEAIKAPDGKTVDRFIAEHPGIFANRLRYTLSQIVFERPADPTLLESMGDDQSLAEIGQTLTSLGINFSRTTAVMDTATVPPQMLSQIQSLPPGEPFIVPLGDRVVASVITGQQSVGLSADENRQAAAELIRRRQLGETLEKQLEQLRTSGKIQYQPGYAPAKEAVPAQSSANSGSKKS